MSTLLATPSVTLTEGQQTALHAFTQFYLDPTESVFVLSGYAGTGKTTLVSYLLQELPKIQKTARLINPQATDYEVVLTATTHKAAEAMTHLSGEGCSTIHSYLGLLVRTDYRTGETLLSPRNQEIKHHKLLFIDEASYVDAKLLSWIFKRTEHCKIVFMGDPAQLTPVKSNQTPVFELSCPKAQLTEVMRQAEDNPILTLATKFRETVASGKFFSFKPDGHHIQYLDRDTFDATLLADMTDPSWGYHDSKFLAWTNKRVIAYNHAIRDQAKGSPDFAPGDYAICNNYVQLANTSIKTDQMVKIEAISEPCEELGVPGRRYYLSQGCTVFMPESLDAKKLRLRQARDDDDVNAMRIIEEEWIDLRAAYACTVNKSQGSTYDRVYIDLDDIRRCNSGEQIARMLYVAVSRARHHVYLTGDLV